MCGVLTHSEIVEFGDDGQCPAERNEGGRQLPHRHQRFDSHDAPFRVDVQHVHQVHPHAVQGALVFALAETDGHPARARCAHARAASRVVPFPHLQHVTTTP